MVTGMARSVVSQALAAGLGGALIAIIGSAAIVAALAGLPTSFVTYAAGAGFVLLWGISVSIALQARSGKGAWRKLVLLSAPFLLSLPLSITLYMLGFLSIDADATGLVMTTKNTLVGGGFGSLVAGFAGFFLGFLALGIGLLFRDD